MIGVFAFWNHALAAGVFATLLLWQLRGGARGTGQWLLLAGLLMTALWTWLTAVGASAAPSPTDSPSPDDKDQS